MIKNPKTISFSASPDPDITDYRIDARRADTNAEVGSFNVTVGTQPGQIEPDGAGLIHVPTAGGSSLRSVIENAAALGVECALFVRADSPEGTSDEVAFDQTFEFVAVVTPPSNAHLEA